MDPYGYLPDVPTMPPSDNSRIRGDVNAAAEYGVDTTFLRGVLNSSSVVLTSDPSQTRALDFPGADPIRIGPLRLNQYGTVVSELAHEGMHDLLARNASSPRVAEALDELASDLVGQTVEGYGELNGQEAIRFANETLASFAGTRMGHVAITAEAASILTAQYRAGEITVAEVEASLAKWRDLYESGVGAPVRGVVVDTPGPPISPDHPSLQWVASLIFGGPVPTFDEVPGVAQLQHEIGR